MSDESRVIYCYCKTGFVCKACRDNMRRIGMNPISDGAVREIREMLPGLYIGDIEEIARLKKSIKIETLYGTG